MRTRGVILIKFEREGEEGTILDGRQGAMLELLRLERALNGLGIGQDSEPMGIGPGWRFHFQEPEFVGEDGALEAAPLIVTEEQFAALREQINKQDTSVTVAVDENGEVPLEVAHLAQPKEMNGITVKLAGRKKV